MKLRPLRNRLWVKKDSPAEETEGGIVIPDVVRDKPTTGVVQAVGPGGRTPAGYPITSEVKPGDHILFKKYDGMNAKVAGEEVFVIPEHDALAIIEYVTVEE